MAAKKKGKSGIPEAVPAQEKSLEVAAPAAEVVEEQQAEDALPGETPEDNDIFAEEQDSVLEEQSETEQEQPEAEQDTPEMAEPGQKLFRITCRNNVSGLIGGVTFVGGVGYTRNAYAASWFANKDGYKVDSE